MLEVVISALSDIIVFWGLRLSKALKQEAQIFVNDWKWDNLFAKLAL